TVVSPSPAPYPWIPRRIGRFRRRPRPVTLYRTAARVRTYAGSWVDSRGKRLLSWPRAGAVAFWGTCRLGGRCRRRRPHATSGEDPGRVRDRWEDRRRDPVHGAGSTLAGTHDVVRFGWRPWEDVGNGGDASPAASPPTPPETSGSPESPRPPTPESPLPAFTDALPITPEVTPRRSRLSGRLTHAVVLAVAVAVVAGGGVWSRAPVPSQPGGSDVMRYASVASAGGPDFSIPAFGGVGLSGYLSAAGVSVTVPQLEVATYMTVEGQTVADVARETGRTVETLLAANNLMDTESVLPAGTSLRVPPTDGILHTVVEGDTVESLAATYGVEPSAIRDYLPNGLSAGAPLVVGRDVMIPGG